MEPKKDTLKEKGVSLRTTFILMLIFSLIVTAALLVTTYRTIRSYQALSKATDDYIEMQEAASSLLSASDYLTEEAQCYTVIGDRKHLENYFEEAEVTRSRERAIEIMEKQLPDSPALANLKEGLQDSINLMDREYYAMLLVLQAQGDTDIPEAMRDVTLSAEDTALSAEEKRILGQKMMHDEEYYRQKNMIREDLKDCIDDLQSGTHGTQTETNKEMKSNLILITVLIILQSITLIVLLWITTRLGINPVLRAVEHIKKDQKLPIMGANEFRYLASTYNKMYAAYKKSIDNLSYQASHDELTGVYNHAGYDLIRQSLDLESTAVLLCDADKFKHINDTYGHEMGDKVLKKIAAALKNNFRADDYICRIGGDEFLVFMVHIGDNVETMIKHKVKQINEDLADESDGVPSISLSVGVSLYNGHADSQVMFNEADTALYYVKEHGRCDCHFYTPDLTVFQ